MRVAIMNWLGQEIGNIIEGCAPDDLFDGEQLAEYVAQNYRPDEVFDRQLLLGWAYGEGLVDPPQE